jgi:hypothetical protein
VTGFTIASGLLDSLAFTHAAGMWKDGRLVWIEATKSAASFLLGMTMYWGAVRYLSEAGIVFAEIQALLWFSVTIVGVAVLGGRFFHWPPLEQLVAVGVLFGLGWLMARTAV